MTDIYSPDIWAIVPAYKVKNQIYDVIDGLLKQPIKGCVVIDDACPEKTGEHVLEKYSNDTRVVVIIHDANKGVGGAVKTGYEYAFSKGADIAVKIDGDGQMDPACIPLLVKPINRCRADYVKGNRFYHPSYPSGMPLIRFIGNSILSIISKFSSGYWTIMDPTNGYTALHKKAYSMLSMSQVSDDYFFENDMLFNLGMIDAVVNDVPINIQYGEDHHSNLSVIGVSAFFPGKFFKRILKRLIFKYYLREFNLASLELFFSIIFLTTGSLFGIYQWLTHYYQSTETPAGTVMIFGLMIIIGFQLMLSFLNYDIASQPRNPLLDQ